MSSFFKKNVPGKAKRNEIPESVKQPLMNILNVSLVYTCNPETGIASVEPTNTPTNESVKISDLYDMSQINFMNGEIPVTKLYLKSGVNASVDGLALQAMVSVVREGLCSVFLKNYFVDYANSELGKRHEYTVGNEKKVHYDTYTGHFFYLIPRTCGLATVAEVKAKAQESKAQESNEENASPFVNPNPVVKNNAKAFGWGAKA
jgi:hypothetical protein